MKIHTNVYRLLALGIGILWASVGEVAAHNGLDTELTKTITKQFAVTASAKVEIVNKYGKIKIEPWEKDSVAIKIVVTTFGKNEASVEKLMERVDFEFRTSDSFVKAETLLDRNSSPIAEFFNSLTDQSKAIFSKSHIQVDYIVQVPTHAMLDIHNRFGDVILGKVRGKSDLRIGHGNLYAESFREEVWMDLSFCHADIGYLAKGDITLRGGSFAVEEADELTLNSLTSEVDIERSRKVRFVSKNDEIELGEAIQVEGEGHFTKLSIMDLSKSADVELNFGSFKIQRVLNTFSDLKVTGNSADIRLDFQQPTYFAIKTDTRADRIEFPEASALEKEYYDRDRFMETEGFIGQKGVQTGNVRIKATSGEVRIRLLEETVRTTRN